MLDASASSSFAVSASGGAEYTAIMAGSANIAITASVNAKILGEDWSLVAVGDETWSEIAAGSEVWTPVSTGTEVWLQQ